MITFDKLYNRDSKGKLRVWWMEVDGDKFRTASGLDDGAITYSEWTTCFAKNVGKKNETSPEEQAVVEVEAQYKKKRDRKYYDNPEEASGAKFIAPMLAISYKDVKKLEFPVLVQAKLDGIRAIVKKDGIFSRQGKPLLGVSHISNILAPFFEEFPDYVLDGEMYNHELKDDFDSLVSYVKKNGEHSHKIEYHIYDVVEDLPFWERYSMLRGDFVNWLQTSAYDSDGKIKFVTTYDVEDQLELDRVYGVMLEKGYEGQMIRIPNGSYEHKRSKNLIKRKEFQDREFEVVEVKEGKGNWSGMAKMVECRLPDGRTFEAGIKGSQVANKSLLERSSAGNQPKYATIRFQNFTPDGIPRFGVSVAFYDGDRDV